MKAIKKMTLKDIKNADNATTTTIFSPCCGILMSINVQFSKRCPMCENEFRLTIGTARAASRSVYVKICSGLEPKLPKMEANVFLHREISCNSLILKLELSNTLTDNQRKEIVKFPGVEGLFSLTRYSLQIRKATLHEWPPIFERICHVLNLCNIRLLVLKGSDADNQKIQEIAELLFGPGNLITEE